jgi:hypothetical protein
MDAWNPATFDPELFETLERNSELIRDYHTEDRRLMDEHLNSDPYESLKPNRFHEAALILSEHTVTPLLRERRIRVWHYTRLTDDEVLAIQRRLEPSTLSSLRRRLHALRHDGLLTQQEAQIVYEQSPFHAQSNMRSDRVCTTTVPLSPDNPGVELLLESWGGEAAYFWLSDETVAAKLRTIGIPRIVEIETALGDKLNAFSAAQTVVQAWARSLDVPVHVSGSDLSIIDCLDTARVLRVHTEGDGLFEQVATTYPIDSDQLLAA